VAFNKFKGVNISASNPGPVRYEPEVMDLSPMFRGDKSPSEIPLNSSPDCQDVRPEGTGMRKDWGWEQIGTGITQAADSRILGLAEHSYYDATLARQINRIIRAYREGDGDCTVDMWDGVDWANTVTSASETILDQYLSIVSTELGGSAGLCLIAGGSDQILKWTETPSTSTTEDDFPSGNDLDAEGESTLKALSAEPAYDNIYIVSYEVYLRFKWDGTGSGDDAWGSVTVVVAIDLSDDNQSTWTEVDAQSYVKVCADELTFCTLDLRAASAPRRTIDAAAEGLSGVTDVRVRIKTYTTVRVASDASKINGCNKATDGDSYAGIEYEVEDSPSYTLTQVSADTTKAHYIFEFAERIIALQDGNDPQKMAWCVSGDATDWAGVGSGTAILEADEKTAFDDLMCGVKMAHEWAVIIRKRNITRLYRTNHPTAPLGYTTWLRGIGTESPHSLQIVRGGAMFLGHDLMPYFLSDGGLVPVGLPVAEVLRDELTGNLELVDSTYDPIEEEYWLGYPANNATTIDTVWTFNVGRFLDKQELVWRKKDMDVQRLALVSTVPRV